MLTLVTASFIQKRPGFPTDNMSSETPRPVTLMSVQPPLTCSPMVKAMLGYTDEFVTLERSHVFNYVNSRALAKAFGREFLASAVSGQSEVVQEGLYPYLVVGSTWLPVTLGGLTIVVPFFVFRPAGPAPIVLGGALLQYLRMTTVQSHIGEVWSARFRIPSRAIRATGELQ